MRVGFVGLGFMGYPMAGHLVRAGHQVCAYNRGAERRQTWQEEYGAEVASSPQEAAEGAAGSWQMINRGTTMAQGEFNFGFAVEHMRKDLKIALKTAEELGAPLPVTALVDQFYSDVEALGGKRYDTSSLIERLRRLRP